MEKTYEAQELLEKGRAAQALEILLELERAYPNTIEVLGQMVNAYYDLHNHDEYEHAVRRLIRLQPHDADLNFALAGAYMVNMRPALAMRIFQDAIRRWPAHPRAAEAAKHLPHLEAMLRDQTRDLNLSDEQAFALASQHEELRYYLGNGDYRMARQTAEKLLRESTDFIPALNNLAQIEAIEGHMERSIELTQRVLQVEPDNIHALSNLARLTFLAGNFAEAAEYAARLKQSRATAADRWAKIAEALTFLEDDDGVLALYDQAKAAGEHEPPETNELFYHLLGVAACFKGKEELARSYWRKALKINPNFDWARSNLEDLDRPPAERSGAWAFPMESWMLAQVSQEVAAHLKRLERSEKKVDIQLALGRLFEEKFQNIFELAPHLYARGNTRTREIVTRLTAVTAHPKLLAVAKEYLSSKRGSFQERFQHAQILADGELLPSGSIKLWKGDETRESLLLSIQISSEAETSALPRKALALLEQAISALHAGEGPRAQELLEKALVIAPGDPSLINNLASAFEMQGQSAHAQRMIVELHERIPDYFFGVIAVAGMEIEKGNLERARDMLNGLLQRKKMHTTEFTAFCRLQIQLAEIEKHIEVAQMWLDVWEKVEPNNPSLMYFRKRLGAKPKALAK